MLFKTSYYSKETKDEIDRLVGKSFGIIKRFQLGGIGSQRLLVHTADSEITALINKQNTPPYTNIELRPKGIIMWFRVKLDNWVLVLPYEQISLIRTNNDVTIRAKQWQLKLLPANNLPLDLNFFKKLLQLM